MLSSVCEHAKSVCRRILDCPRLVISKTMKILSRHSNFCSSYETSHHTVVNSDSFPREPVRNGLRSHVAAGINAFLGELTVILLAQAH